MVVTKKNFPTTLKEKILSGVKKRKLDITFIDGAIIDAPNTNIRFIEPYRILFKSKTCDPVKYLVAIIFDDELGSKQTIFVNDIGDKNKCSMTKLIQLINENVC